MTKYIFITILAVFLAFASFSQEVNSLNNSDIKELRNSFDSENSTNKALYNAISSNDINKIATNTNTVGKNQHYFKYKVEVKGITDQKSSGRCWMFTGLNSLRPEIITSKNLDSFEFSTNYLYFWDLLEKSNLFLENIIAHSTEELNSRHNEWLLKSPIGDGGVWNSFANIVTKYGAVPSKVMPETYHSENTRMLNSIIKEKLREDALILRAINNTEKQQETKIDMLKDIYRILALCLGEPPQNFEYRFIDKDNKAGENITYTPNTFFKTFFKSFDIENYVMLMNDPTREYFKLYEIESDRNVLEGKNWQYINLPNEKIKEYSIASIKANKGMYASCDVGKYKNNDEGTLDLNNYDYEALFGIDLDMNKKSRISTFQSGSSHAMLLMAVDTDKDENSTMWQFENSWGKSYGHNGYLTFTDNWFNEYMFRVVVEKEFIDADVLKILESEPIMLPPWDPMFSIDK